MPFDETKLEEKMELLADRMGVLNRAMHDVKHCHDALDEIKDMITRVSDPDAPEGTIGRMIEKKSKPEDVQVGGEITDARRNQVYDKRMAEADTLLAQTV